MAFVSVTRLRPRGLRFAPAVLIDSWRSGKRLRQAEGFLGGYLGTGPRMVFWTVTMWADEDAMRAFRDSDPHRAAMPKLMEICDEASVVHWQGDDLPSPAEAAERMRGGRASKLRHPSAAHAAGETWPDGKAPLKGPGLPL